MVLLLWLLRHVWPGRRTTVLAALPAEVVDLVVGLRNVQTELEAYPEAKSSPLYQAVESARHEWADVITVAADVLGIDSDETL